MDAHEDDLDIKLQRISGDLIADFDRSLLPYLRKPDALGGTVVRSRVRSRETRRLVSTLLDPFQELPQLLDPHLPRWLPLLASNFLESLQARRPSGPLSTRSDLLMPLRSGISRILYTFCKVRGEKVVVRFLHNETRYLELLLSALEESERAEPAEPWTWEQRYVVLLWLSHLFLAPFDLATISSVDVDAEDLPRVPGFLWPPDLPGITVRVLPLALKHLASPGKERDAAKALLIRVATRRDMQGLGVLHALVQWALSSLRGGSGAAPGTPYYYIGVLSFLAGVLASSANTSDMDQYLVPIFNGAYAAASEQGSPAATVASSALARKALIKVIRSTAVLMLRGGQLDSAGTELVETIIGYLLECLADNDTPVRLAASKALSVITLRLDVDMASQVVEAVLESLNRNVLRVKDPLDQGAAPTRDISSVNPLEWHGLMLTLSHLLYRRSPPADNLPDIIQALLMGLSFEQRSTSGSSVGTNVRDASCFGIWALARRYTTKELLLVPAESISAAKARRAQATVLQILATELMMAASLDPAGNIRRGSSAALQELVGRHPDTVEKGIWLVQTVDYHAVALRSRAIQEVALAATRLSSQYGEAILEALLSWKGIGHVDAASRRAAAASFGAVAAELASPSPDPLRQLSGTVQLLIRRIRSLQPRQVEERHGLLLSFAAVLDRVPTTAGPSSGKVPLSSIAAGGLARTALGALEMILTDCKDKKYRRPELVAEAASHLVTSSFPLLQAAVLGTTDAEDENSISAPALSGPAFVSSIGTHVFEDILTAMDAADESRRDPIRALLVLFASNMSEWVKRPEDETMPTLSQAALVFLSTCGHMVRQETVRGWAETVRRVPTSRAGLVGSHFSALIAAYPTTSTAGHQSQASSAIRSAILDRWAGDKDVGVRVSILQSLSESDMLRQNAAEFVGVVEEGLEDYTTNARGDVGSLVRLQAIKVTRTLWQSLRTEQAGEVRNPTSRLFPRILRLAAEKLDRVRVEAQVTLALAMTTGYSAQLTDLTFSSRSYFRFLLDLLSSERLCPAVRSAAEGDPEKWMEELLAGYVSSADMGNEDLVIASRAALTEFCDASQENLDAVCTALARNLKAWQGQDRVLVPTLEIVGFLLHCGTFERCGAVDYRGLCLQVQKAGYKTGNVRKLEACVRAYGAIAAVEAGPMASETLERRKREGAREARKRLGPLLRHPWPRVRAMVVDELWCLISRESPDAAEKLKGVDWGRAEKGAIEALIGELSLA